MPRVGRVVLQNYPHHVVERGHNKQVVFAEVADYRYYLKTLGEFKDLYGVKVYGFCLMTNHTHLLLEPGDTIAGLGQLMKRLAGRQTRFANRQESRTGTLWEGRYKSSPIQTDTYLLACSRYIELNPVRAAFTLLSSQHSLAFAKASAMSPGDKSDFEAKPLQSPPKSADFSCRGTRKDDRRHESVLTTDSDLEHKVYSDPSSRDRRP